MSEYKTIKQGFKTFIKGTKENPDPLNLMPHIKEQVEQTSRIAILGALCFYYYIYDKLTQYDDADIKREFIQARHDGSKPVPYQQLNPCDKIYGFFRKMNSNTKAIAGTRPLPQVHGFDQIIQRYGILKPTHRLNNSLKYMANDYEQSLRNNIGQHGYKRLQYVFRYILNAKIAPETNQEEKEKKKSDNNKKVYLYLRHLFDGSEETMMNFVPSQTMEDLFEDNIGSDDDSDPCSEEKYTASQLSNVFQNSEDLFDDYDYNDDNDDFNMADLSNVNADGSFENDLIDFVEKTLKPFEYNKNSFGKGVMCCMTHPTAYYSYIPMFFRLQRFIEKEINEKVNANIRNFALLPVYSYKVKHITLDSSDLFYLMNIAGKIDIEISGRKTTSTQFLAAKNDNNIPLKWFQIFETKSFNKKKQWISFLRTNKN